MLPKYKYLLTYRYSEVLQDLTMVFCEKNISKFSRTFDQMVQAARSGKQCIVEAVGQSRTSKKGEIKLLGVSLGSIEELIMDYEDFLRQKKLTIWPKTDERIRNFRNLGIVATKLDFPRKIELSEDPQEAANLLLTFAHQLTYLLSRQISALEEKFAREGGFTENLLRRRLSSRSPK